MTRQSSRRQRGALPTEEIEHRGRAECLDPASTPELAPGRGHVLATIRRVWGGGTCLLVTPDLPGPAGGRAWRKRVGSSSRHSSTRAALELRRRGVRAKRLTPSDGASRRCGAHNKVGRAERYSGPDDPTYAEVWKEERTRPEEHAPEEEQLRQEDTPEGGCHHRDSTRSWTVTLHFGRSRVAQPNAATPM